MDLESFGLDFLLPRVIVDLNVVEDGVDEDSNVRVLIREEFKHNRDHHGRVQHDFSSWAEEKEFKEGVQDLLHHLVVLLLSTKEVLEELDQVTVSDELSTSVVSSDSAHEHDTLQHNIVLSVSVLKVIR